MRFPFFKKKDRAPPEQKSVSSWIVAMGAMRAMAQNYNAFAAEGYGQNPIVHACVDKIATALSSVDILLYQKKAGKLALYEKDHPLKKLVADRPNPLSSGRTFIDRLTRYWLIGGSAYVYGVGMEKSNKPPEELYLLSPACMLVKENPGSPFPAAFEYRKNQAQTVTYPVDQITGRCAVLHVKTFNPFDPLNGLSPMVAASYGVDVFNAGQKWNLSLLQNEARPSGAMVVNGSDGKPATLSEEQYTRLKQQIDKQFSGSQNAGRPMLLEGGLDWKQMSMTAKDMDHRETMLNNARFIASVYGVPPMLINIPGSETYANYEQARLALWTDTVLPKLSMLLDEFNRWLTPLYGDNLQLWYDEDMIPALEPLRKQKGDRINTSNYLTVDEKRTAMGYDKLPGKIGNVVLVPQSDIPLDLAGDMGLSEPGSQQDQGDGTQTEEDDEAG